MKVIISLPDHVLGMPDKVKAGLEAGIKRVTADLTTATMDNAPRKTGTLKRSIHAEMSGMGGTFTGKVIQDTGVAKYGPWVHNGTGIYGPHGTPIVPVNASFLRWKAPDGRWIRAKSVKGMKPRPFMKEAFDEKKPEIPVKIKDSIMREVEK